jgi:Icc-related predicted phosphoesterase
MEPPPGDILVIAGDWTYGGKPDELYQFNEDLGKIRKNYRKIFVTPGNHDFLAFTSSELVIPLLTNAVYCEDKLIQMDKKRIYFSPWIPPIGGWAFEYRTANMARHIWEKIPPKLNLLVTHTPPSGVGLLEWSDNSYRHGPSGCPYLRERIDKVKPKFHVFGHIHEGYGMIEQKGTTFINVSSLKRDYETINPAIVITI